ncbi:hypothetical protein DNTS_018298 [Danionella cerebrum]|uniref:DNA-directed RNA polymerase subunit n=1 Tax=Danionella cerebrum TaxID=2873325 RepID=A0A553QEL9_9TELE|nr:hypothetical protein DNTS_018298 [Danionella translucida]
MFVLVEMEDTVRTPPWGFHRQLNEAIEEELNKKLANKVVYNVGLCICLYDIIKLDDSFIFPGDGASHTKVTLGFFDDIIIPPESLQQPAKFDEGEQVWLWEYETDEGTHDLYMDRGEEIRFRVTDELFIDTSPSGPSKGGENEDVAAEETQTPYTLIGSVSEPGLGLLSWWNN